MSICFSENACDRRTGTAEKTHSRLFAIALSLPGRIYVYDIVTSRESRGVRPGVPVLISGKFVGTGSRPWCPQVFGPCCLVFDFVVICNHSHECERHGNITVHRNVCRHLIRPSSRADGCNRHDMTIALEVTAHAPVYTMPLRPHMSFRTCTTGPVYLCRALSK